MKTKLSYLLFLFIIATSYQATAQQETKSKSPFSFDGPKGRVGIFFQYSTNFKNVNIDYLGLDYTGQLGGFTGKGGEIFGGYKLHKYLALDLSAGILINSYSRDYGPGLFITGRFNKFYLHPNVKFIYPLFNGNFGSICPYFGGGLGFNGSGRAYLEDQVYGFKAKTYARYETMVAPFFVFGAEIHFDDLSNLIIGLKYQNGSYTAKDYHDDYNPGVTLKSAPEEWTNMSAQGIGLMLGIMHEF